MQKKMLLLLFLFAPFFLLAQQSREDFERGLKLLEKQGTLKLENNTITFLNMRPGDTAFYRELYNKMLEKVDQSKNPYVINFEIDPKYLNKKNQVISIKPAPKDSSKQMVLSPALQQIKTQIAKPQYLKNGDFEEGYFRSLPGWTISGKAFQQVNGTANFTWNDFDVVSKADIGGSYWQDLKFNTGFKHQHWITSKSDQLTGSNAESGKATGTLVSDPFKIYAGQNFISFLVAGGNDAAQLKVELLQFGTMPRLTGNVAGVLKNQPTLPGQSNGNVSTVLDTVYTVVPGIPAKTGHNNFIFRRDWWDISRLDTSKQYVIRITDNSTNLNWGIINVDDFRMLRNNPSLNRETSDSLKVQTISIKDMVSNADQNIVADMYVPIYGAADLHTHLMSHLSMGHKLIYGAPDIGSIVPAGTYFCNRGNYRAATVDDCLGNCNSAHGGWGADLGQRSDNWCGNYLRAAILNYAFDSEFENRVSFDRNPHGDHPHEGYPDFLYWPHFSSASHQQMYVDWIKRAYQGGLRVLVTLTVNSELLGAVLSGDGPFDDKSVADTQIVEIKSFVSRHNDFMELAYTPEDMRRIIRSNKMAVLLGMEVDNIGNFNYADVMVNEQIVKAEINRLYDKGVRYIFPIHLVNNKFGGSAIYSLLFNLSNKYTNSRPLPWGTPIPPGLMFNVQAASDPKIKYTLNLAGGPTGGAMNAAIVGAGAFFDAISEMSYPPAINLDPTSGDFCPIPKLGCIQQFKIVKSLLTIDPAWDMYGTISGGQQNQLGLTNIGKAAVKEMMRLGMIIDIDHMSDHSVTDALQLANDFNYPVSSGHNNLREGFYEKEDHKVSENQRSNQQLQTIRRLGGIFGLGIGESTSAQYLQNFRLAIQGGRMGAGAVMMGSDINGCVVMPKPRHGDGRGAERSRYTGLIYSNWTKQVQYAGEAMPTNYTPSTGAYTLRRYQFGNKKWDYNTEGVAHIGLFPDYFQDLKNLGMTQDERQIFFSAADYIVNMWDKCQHNKQNVH